MNSIVQQVGSIFGNYPDGMYDAGYIAENGEQNIEPEVFSKTHLHKNAERG